MDKTFASFIAAFVFVLIASVSFADETTTTENRQVASDFSSDYLEQVKDERAAEQTQRQKDEIEHDKYLKSMNGRDR
jgi:hypothetical protein